MRRWLLVLGLSLWAPLARANQAAHGFCEAGAQPVVTSGLTSQTKVQASFPACTVTVFIHGGGTATIFADNSGTPLANPFTAQSNGQWIFYAANGRYDIQLSGSGFPTPITITDFSLADPANQSAALPNTIVSFSATPDFPSTNNASYTLTLTGNVTSSTASGTPANGNLLSLTLIEDSVGGRTMTFPANFIQPLGFSFNTTALATNALTWKFDGTNWNLISNTGSGGGANPGPPPNSLQKNNGAGALSASSVVDDGTKVSISEDLNPKGPNPYVDIRSFGARASNPNLTPSAVGLTANCNSVTNPTQVTISAASTFVNGDGVVLYGCGAPQSMATPTGLAVAPNVAKVGTATGIVAAGATGSATYNYKILARDKNGGLTAASATASTTIGAASLGAQTVNITSISATNDAFTVTTASAHGFLVGCSSPGGGCGEVFIGGGNGITDVRFRGWWPVSSVADSTHFTVTGIFFDTRNGASTSATGGTATWYNCNHLTWSAVTGAWNFYIYSDRASPGTFVLVGVSRPQGTQNTDLTFDDFGSPFMDNQVFPPYVPVNPPSLATSDHLSTTIASGAGTTTLTLANAAGTTVSGATVRLDAGPAITAAAATSGGIFIPTTSGVNQFVVNSYTLISQNVAVTQSGPLYLNETLEYSPSSNGSVWSGDKVNVQFGTSTSSQWHPTTTINVNTANPGIYVGTNNGGFYFSGISFVQQPSNGALQLFTESGFNQTFEKMLFSTSQNGNQDFMGIGLYQRGKAGVGSATNIIIDQVGFAPGGTGDGFSHTPVWYVSDMGNLTVRSAFFLHRGAVLAIDPSGGGITIQHSYINGGVMPLYTISTGATGNGSISLGTITMDTIAHPCIAAFGPRLSGITGGCSPSSGVSEFTGNRSPTPTGGGNRDSGVFGIYTGAQDGIFNGLPWSLQTYNAGLAVGTNYPIFIISTAPAQPTCSVSAGGSLAVGSYQFTVVPLWQNGGEGTPSPISSTCTTSTGNQTITINWTAASGNPKGYDVYFCSASCSSAGSTSSTTFNNPQSASATSLVWSSNNPSGIVYNGGIAGGPTMLMPGTQGMASPSFTMTDPAGFGGKLVSTTLTAARTHTFSDNSGTVAELNEAQTWTADQSFANANGIRFFSPNGTNWTKLTGAGSNPASNITFQLPSADSTGVQCLSSNGSGVLAFSACSGGTGTPGGSTTQVQFNSAGSFGGSPNLTWVSPALTIGVNASATGQVLLANGGAGGASVTVQNPSATSGYNFNLPIGAGTSGQPLVSGGGGSTAMTFGTLSVGGGGTGATTFGANQLLSGNGTSAVSALTGSLTGTNPVLTLTSGATGNVPFAVNTPASPTADLFDLSINSVKTSFFDNVGNLHAPQATFTGSGPFVMSGNGGTCPSPATNNYIICLGDLGSTSAQLSNNGVTFKPIVQFTNTAPTAHGVALATPTFPQISTTAAGASGVPLVGQGSTSDPIFTTLGVAGGGTGATTLAAHGTVIAEGTSALTVAGPDATSNQPLLSQGASADPSFGALPLGNSNAVSGVLATANGGTGASSLSGASIVTVTGVITTNDCVKFSAATVVTDAGAACGAVGSVALSGITAGTASNTINSTVFPQTWNWALTGSTTGFQFGENTAATGASNIILSAHTLATSTALPFSADNAGNGWQLSSAGQLQRLGTASLAVPGTAHGVVVSEGATGAIATPATGTAGQVLISNGSSSDPSFQDPVVSQAFVNIWTAQDVTTTRTSANVRNPIFSQTATLQMTWASITGSPATCTLQIQGVDSQGNALSNGGTVSVSPANGTTSQTFTAAAGLQTAAQVKVILACVTYPTTGTLTLDFTPIPNVNVTNTVAVSGTVTTTPPANASTNVTQFGGVAVSTGTGASGTGIPRVTISNDSSLAANQSVNVNQISGSAISTAATGVQKVGVVGNAGATVDGAPGSAVPTNVVAEGLSDGTNSRRALSDTTGRQFMLPYLDTTTTSYHASKNVASAASATDISVLPGNATNTVLVYRVQITCTQTTAGIITLQIIKRSTADTAGTSSAMTVVPDDANYAAGVSAPLVYTANPTTGTAVGNLDTALVGCMATGTASPNDIYVFKPFKPIVLRGTAQQLAVNLNGVTVTGGSFDVTFDYAETTTP